MAEKRTDLLIIGGGAAGNAAAFAARAADPHLKIMIVTREKWTEYSAPALPDYLSGELSLEKLMVRTEADYKAAGIRLVREEVIQEVDAAGRKAITDKGTVIRWKNLIFATGSFPIQLRRMQGTGLPGNFVCKTIEDIDGMIGCGAKRAVVVGSGAIGLEGSMALKARGVEEVTMVEALDWLSMKSLDQETSDELKAALKGFGVKVITGEAVQGVEGTNKVEAVLTSRRRIACDLVLWGIGMRADTELAKAAGVEIGELGGIRVDDHMRTNLPHVYACGDCTESRDLLSGAPAMHLFWEPAQRGGVTAGENCAGLDSVFTGSVAIFLTHKGGLKIVGFGKTESELGDSGRVITERRRGIYRRLLFADGLLQGAQMVGTLKDSDLLLDYLQRSALPRPGAWDLREPIPEEELSRMSVSDCIRHFRKERRTQLKSGPSGI